jgi:GT2 family glycosyltransferase
MHPLYLVTVTYASRLHLLLETLRSAFREGVGHAIVVNNAADDPVEEVLRDLFGELVTVATFPSNTGSAFAYSHGMRMAVKEGAEYLLLLDDDNTLDPGSLEMLLAGYRECARSCSCDSLTVLGCRPDHHADVLEGVAENRVNLRAESFLGFHVADIPFKIWRRSPWFRKGPDALRPPERIRVDTAPYSGMFFHVSLLVRHGYPDPGFVLYGDDSEFSYRITLAGGANVLITGAGLTDLESSWNLREKKASSFGSWLRGEGDFRAYYASRNGSYFEHFIRPHNRLVRRLNKELYLVLLWIAAVRSGRMQRYRLIQRGIAEGEAGRLGMSPDFML